MWADREQFIKLPGPLGRVFKFVGILKVTGNEQMGCYIQEIRKE